METLLLSALLAPVEALANAGIKRDLKLARALATHAGRLLEIEVVSPPARILVHFTDAGVRLGLRPNDAAGVKAGTRDDLQPDAGISGSAAALMSLMLDPTRSQAVVNPALKVTGDSEFVAQVHRLFRDLEIDWQSSLADLIGDVPTHMLEELLSGVSRLARDSARAARRNIDEYLHEEVRLVPPPNQVAMLDQQLDSLRLRLDRLEARVCQLAGRLESRVQQQSDRLA